jgi:hypothetical protein
MPLRRHKMTEKMTRSQGTDTLEEVKVEPMFDGISEPLRDALLLMHSVDESSVESYIKAIDSLNSEPERTVAEVSAQYGTLPYDAYLPKWSLLYVLAEVNHPAATDFFLEVACREIPAIEYHSHECEAPGESALLVGAMAVEGLLRLASVDRRAATQALLAVIERQGHIAIRSAAVEALRAANPELLPRVESMLPVRQRWIVDLRRAAPEDLIAYQDETDLQSAPKRPVGRSPRLPEDTTAPQIDERST